jgi:hypothetical protein
MPNWMVRSLGGEAEGPYSTEQIIAAVDAGDLGVEIEVTPEGEQKWLPIEMVPEFADLAFFDGETNVVDAPWLADMAREMAAARKASEPKMPAASVTLASAAVTAPVEATPRAPDPTHKPATTTPPRPDKTLASAAQPAVAPKAGVTLPLGAYVYDDEYVATKVVASPAELLEAAGRSTTTATMNADEQAPDRMHTPAPDAAPESNGEALAETAQHQFESVPPSSVQSADLYDDFDETMTRVAVRSDPAEPALRPPTPGGGVLPTLTMNRDFSPMTANQPAQEAPHAAAQAVHLGGLGVDPLAATARPFGTDSVQPYVPGPQAAAPAQQADGPYAQPQPNFDQPYDPAQPTYQYGELPEETNETGVKALIFLIVVLAMALTVVLVLLINQS